MKLADRLDRLGTETAFAVSAEAAAFAAAGNKVYPFHIGDLNVKTPRNIVDATFRAIDAGKTGYCSNYGIQPLREELAKRFSYGGSNPLSASGLPPEVDSETRRLVESFLSRCAEGKYAPGVPAREELDRIWDDAKRILQLPVPPR